MDIINSAVGFLGEMLKGSSSSSVSRTTNRPMKVVQRKHNGTAVRQTHNIGREKVAIDASTQLGKRGVSEASGGACKILKCELSQKSDIVLNVMSRTGCAYLPKEDSAYSCFESIADIVNIHLAVFHDDSGIQSAEDVAFFMKGKLVQMLVQYNEKNPLEKKSIIYQLKEYLDLQITDIPSNMGPKFLFEERIIFDNIRDMLRESCENGGALGLRTLSEKRIIIGLASLMYGIPIKFLSYDEEKGDHSTTYFCPTKQSGEILYKYFDYMIPHTDHFVVFDTEGDQKSEEEKLERRSELSCPNQKSTILWHKPGDHFEVGIAQKDLKRMHDMVQEGTHKHHTVLRKMCSNVMTK